MIHSQPTWRQPTPQLAWVSERERLATNQKADCSNQSGRTKSRKRAVENKRPSSSTSLSDHSGDPANTAKFDVLCPPIDNLAITLPLSKGLFALIDLEDEEKVRAIGKWSATWTKVGYYGMQVDHVDANTLDCRKSKLRLVTQSQNNANRRKVSIGSSRFKGADLHVGKWRATIRKECAKERELLKENG